MVFQIGMAHERLQNCLAIRVCFFYPIPRLEINPIIFRLLLTLPLISHPFTDGPVVKQQIRWCHDERLLFSRCLRASCVTAIVVWKLISSDLASRNINIVDNLTQKLRMSNKNLRIVFLKEIDQYHGKSNCQRWKLTYPFPAIVITSTHRATHRSK